MTKSSYFLSKLAELQSDSAAAILRIMRSKELGGKAQVQTTNGSFIIKSNAGKPGAYLSIDDGQDTLTEFTINPNELLSILEALEEQYCRED